MAVQPNPFVSVVVADDGLPRLRQLSVVSVAHASRVGPAPLVADLQDLLDADNDAEPTAREARNSDRGERRAPLVYGQGVLQNDAFVLQRRHPAVVKG